MFQLRYLIASDRRLSPVRFTHRSHRFQGTSPDEFHTGHKTFICDSYAQFLEIFEHEVRTSPTAKIVPLIELYNPATGERRHLDGTEQVTVMIPLEEIDVDLTLGPPPKDSMPSFEECEAAVADGTATALHKFIETHEPTAPHDREFRKDLEAAIKEAQATPAGEGSAVTPDGNQTSPASGSEPNPPPIQPPQTTANEPEAPSTTANASASEQPPATASLADRIKPLVTEKKRTVTDLANDLGVAKDVITAAAKTEGSGLTYASGWVGLAD